MSDFKFLKNSSGKWLISAPKRAKRPDQSSGSEPECPFEGREPEIFSLGEVSVVANRYPFANIHEVIVHSRDHKKDFHELTKPQVEDIIKVYKSRFNLYRDQGQVFIFNNHGQIAGESLPHPHTQLVIIPNEVDLEISPLHIGDEEIKTQTLFYMFCPNTSEWPDEVWIAPIRKGISFNEINDEEIKELSFILPRLIKIFTLRYGHEFPYNFYIYPGKGWYLRFIPRIKTLGGFEIGTKVFVSTAVPEETFKFIREHFDKPDFEKIKSQHQADYDKGI